MIDQGFININLHKITGLVNGHWDVANVQNQISYSTPPAPDGSLSNTDAEKHRSWM
jgi:hypothetical protein